MINAWVRIRLVLITVIVNSLILAWPHTSTGQTLAPDDVVLWTAMASPSDVHGDWVREVDSTAAGGVVLRNPDRGRLKIAAALAEPANYFEMRFTAKRATAYHLWIRMKAKRDSTRNDSLHVQFSDSVTATGEPFIRIGSTTSAELVLQNGPSGESPSEWGWTDNGWGTAGEPIYFAADGLQIIRIQPREDGAAIDQVVLSPARFAVLAPGASQSDATILPRSMSLGPAASPETSIIHVASAAENRLFGTWQTISDSTAAASQALRNPDEDAPRIAPALNSPASYFEATFTADAGRPYHVWVRIRADGNSTSNDSVHVQFDDSLTSTSSPTARIGTSSSLEIVLQDGSTGAPPSAWGWADNGWGVLGDHIYFASSSTHTIRVQQREDGAVIDQIVISPDSFLMTPPGWRLDDLTILQSSAPPPPPPNNLPPTVSLTSPTPGATFTAPATVALSATALDPENRLSKVDFYSGSTLLATDTSAPYSFTWASVPAGSYSLRAVAHDSDGGSTSSAAVSVTVTGGLALPDGQLNQDIGGPSLAGSVQYSGGTYTVRAAGEDIWDTSDQFHYVYRPITGDIVITARVASVQAIDPWTKAGVMIRETLTAGSRHAFAHATGGNGYWLTRRVDASGFSSLTAAGSSGSAPGWVRLIRRGNTFEMYRSNDGVNWTAFDSVQITMASTVYIGLAVTSHNASTTTTAVFDNLSVTVPTNQPPSVVLTAPANGATFTAPATITLSATVSDPENRLAKIDFYSGSTLLTSDTTAPFSFSWSSVAAGTYQLKAVATDADGGSSSSSTVTVTVSTSTGSTRRLAFTASEDHAIVTTYLLEVFSSTANPATATPIASSDLGKPTPDGNDEIIVDRTTFLNGLAPGSYLVTVASVGAGGSSRSTAISFTR